MIGGRPVRKKKNLYMRSCKRCNTIIRVITRKSKICADCKLPTGAQNKKKEVENGES